MPGELGFSLVGNHPNSNKRFDRVACLPMQLLYVESNKAAATFFANWACAQAGIKWQVHCVTDDFEAIDYLSGLNHFADRGVFPLPQIVWLRLKAGTRNGLDLLAWLRGAGQFRHLPIVLSSTAGTSAEEISARALAPQARFAQTSDWQDVLGLCKNLLFWRTALTHQPAFFPAHVGSLAETATARKRKGACLCT